VAEPALESSLPGQELAFKLRDEAIENTNRSITGAVLDIEKFVTIMTAFYAPSFYDARLLSKTFRTFNITSHH